MLKWLAGYCCSLYMQTHSGSFWLLQKCILSNIEITMELFFMKKKHQHRKREYYSVTVKCSQTYMFHFGLQCKTFRTWSGCQVSHYVFEGLWFPRSTFTTSEKKKSTKPWWRYYCYRYRQFWCQSLKTHEYKLCRSACVWSCRGSACRTSIIILWTTTDTAPFSTILTQAVAVTPRHIKHCSL